VTPYVMQETTIGKDKIPIKKEIIPLHTTAHSLKLEPQYLTDPEFNQIELIKGIGEQIDERNSQLLNNVS